MAKVLTAGSEVVCGHKGNLSLSTSSKLKISGKAVVTKVGPSISDCTTQDNPQAGTIQCRTASPIGGQAVKLKVAGAAVMLDSVSGVTAGNPSGTVTATAKQDKLSAM